MTSSYPTINASDGGWSFEQRRYLDGMEDRIVSRTTAALQCYIRTQPADVQDLARVASQLVPLLVPALKDALPLILQSSGGGVTSTDSNFEPWSPSVNSPYRESAASHHSSDDDETEVQERELPLFKSTEKAESTPWKLRTEMQYLRNMQGVRNLDLGGTVSGSVHPLITPHIKSPVKYWDSVGQLFKETNSIPYFATCTLLPEHCDDETSQLSTESFEDDTASTNHIELATSPSPRTTLKSCTAFVQSQTSSHSSPCLTWIQQNVSDDQSTEQKEDEHVRQEHHVSASSSPTSTCSDTSETPPPCTVSSRITTSASTVIQDNQIANSTVDIAMNLVVDTDTSDTSTDLTTAVIATNYGEEIVNPQACPDSHSEMDNDLMKDVQASGAADVIEPARLIVHDTRQDEDMAEGLQEAPAIASTSLNQPVVSIPTMNSSTHQDSQNMSSSSQTIATVATAPSWTLPTTTPVAVTPSPSAAGRETTTLAQIRNDVATTPSLENIQAEKTRALLDILAKARQNLMNDKTYASHLDLMKLPWDDPSVHQPVIDFFTRHSKWGAGSLDTAIMKAKDSLEEEGLFCKAFSSLTLIWHCVHIWHRSKLQVLDPSRNVGIGAKTRRVETTRLFDMLAIANRELLHQKHPDGCMTWDELRRLAQATELAFFPNRRLPEIRKEYYVEYMEEQRKRVSKTTVLNFIANRNGVQQAMTNQQTTTPAAMASSGVLNAKKRTISETSVKDHAPATQEDAKRMRNGPEQPRALAGLKRRTGSAKESDGEEAKMKRTREK